ncbi:MAG: hypothetical protein R3F43_15480 [bacterium]
MHSNSFMSALRPGTLIARRFRILELIGEGASGRSTRRKRSASVAMWRSS